MGGGLIQQVEMARNRQQGKVQKELASVLRLGSTGAQPGVSYLSFLTLQPLQGGCSYPHPAWQAKGLELRKVNSCFLPVISKGFHCYLCSLSCDLK